jgi:hypothetical protein
VFLCNDSILAACAIVTSSGLSFTLALHSALHTCYSRPNVPDGGRVCSEALRLHLRLLCISGQ